jgi:hypothetical protein
MHPNRLQIPTSGLESDQAKILSRKNQLSELASHDFGYGQKAST